METHATERSPAHSGTPPRPPVSRLSRILRLCALVYVVASLAVVWGYSVARYHVFPSRMLKPALDQIDWAVKRGTLRHVQLETATERLPHPVAFDTGWRDEGLLLLSRFDYQARQVVVDLVRAHQYTRLHRWVPPVGAIQDATGMRDSINTVVSYRAQHPLLLPDGSLVLHSGEGPLVRIDKNSNLVWAIPRHFHHAIELDADSVLVVPAVAEEPYRGYPVEYRDDSYARVTLDGRLLEERSVSRILVDNGYRGLLLGIGKVHGDPIHLNDAQPVTHDLGIARKGDIALSCRHLSTVFLYRPSTDSVVWLKTGPWLNQHDVNILDDGRFSIFGNDAYRVGDTLRGISGVSDVYLYDPVADSLARPYARMLQALGVFTGTSGRARILGNGDLFVEETDNHSLYRLSEHMLRWHYTNLVTEGVAGAIHWCRYLYAGEVDTTWLGGS